MHPSVRVFAARVHTPLIRFLGKRSWPSSPEAPHAHPFAPPEFQSKTYSKATSASESSKNVFHEFWEAPEKFWKPRVHQLEETEIDAILSGGASMRS
ncbi:hypothetical protein BDP27DRAFT_1282993 [Rhodocollybia butyracea]|uniref:Uncharacterized protein n=1 Tax=Rhodocollybia butyracea TaxID=206335 RepID=A0A9P5Q8X1_9AGAR|nr:hypothetical protein BDP27DRAFT_1282993 [Rhodocollybia butyracea]